MVRVTVPFAGALITAKVSTSVCPDGCVAVNVPEMGEAPVTDPLAAVGGK